MHDSQVSGVGDANDLFLASLAAGPLLLDDGRAPWERPPPRPPLAGDGSDCDDVVVERLAELAASAVPLRRILAMLAGRFVRAKGWERLSFARLGDYAPERVGLSARQLNDLARVDEALDRLPRIEAALLSGQLSWTKTRLLCRVATPRDEEHWLDVAAGMSAEALAREVRAVDARSIEKGGADSPPADELRRGFVHEGEEEPREPLRLECSRYVRAKWRAARGLAARRAGRPLKHWEAAEYVAAEVLSAIGLDAGLDARLDAEPGDALTATPASGRAAACDLALPRDGAPPRAAHRQKHAASPAATPAPALPAPLRALVDGLESADAFSLDARLRKAVKLERLHLSRLGPWLLTVARKRLYRDLGYRSLDAYASSELGLASSKARALVRLERVALASPCFREAWRQGALSWTLAEALAPLFEIEGAEPWQPAWLEHAGAVSVRRLRDDVDQALALNAFAPPMCPADPRGVPTGARPTESEEGMKARPNADDWNAPDPPARTAPAPSGVPTGAQPTDWETGIGAWRSGDEWRSLDPSLQPLQPLQPNQPPAGVPTGARPRGGELGGGARIPRAERAQLCFVSPRSVTRLFHAVLATVQRRIERAENRPSSPSEALDWMLEHVFEAWGRYDPVPARYRIHERDEWRCAVPGCSSYGNLQLHHIVFRSRGGKDRPENLVTMCLWHHLRATHGHAQHGPVMSCRGKAPRGLRFNLGLRETGPPLAVYRSGDRLMRA